MPSQRAAAVLIAVLFTCTVVPLSAAQESQTTEDSLVSPDAIVYVDGLACPFCAYGLEKKLKKLDAVQKMEVQLEKGRVLLTFKEEQSLTKEQIQAAVKKAGFTARKIEFPEDASSGTPSS